MWYFSWVLGFGLACTFAVLNAMWYELFDDAEARRMVREPAGRDKAAKK